MKKDAKSVDTGPVNPAVDGGSAKSVVFGDALAGSGSRDRTAPIVPIVPATPAQSPIAPDEQAKWLRRHSPVRIQRLIPSSVVTASGRPCLATGTLDVASSSLSRSRGDVNVSMKCDVYFKLSKPCRLSERIQPVPALEAEAVHREAHLHRDRGGNGACDSACVRAAQDPGLCALRNLARSDVFLSNLTASETAKPMAPSSPSVRMKTWPGALLSIMNLFWRLLPQRRRPFVAKVSCVGLMLSGMSSRVRSRTARIISQTSLPSPVVACCLKCYARSACRLLFIARVLSVFFAHTRVARGGVLDSCLIWAVRLLALVYSAY